MNLLLTPKTMDVGGIERTVVALARELQAAGHRVWVVSGGGHLVAELQANHIPHCVAPLTLASPLALLRSARKLRRIVAQAQIQLVHSFSAPSSVAASIALAGLRTGRARSVPLVASPMGLQQSEREPGLVTRWRNRLLLLGAQKVLVISPEIRRELERLGVSQDRLVDFNFVGFDPQRFRADGTEAQAVRAEWGLPQDSPIVATIGALHPRKAHDLFLEAAREVAQAVPNARFLVVGEGELRAELERYAARLGLDGRVVFTGQRDDVARLLAASDVYVKPGVVEGFIGITVLEAMALERPVVAFDTEDVKMAIDDGRTGLLAERGNSPALAASITGLLLDPQRARRLGTAGRGLVEERFDFGQLARRLAAFYQSMLPGDAAPARV